MKSFRIIFMPRAFSELKAIHSYIAADSPQNAPTMVERILDALESLKTLPHRTRVKGRSRRERNPVRSVPVWPYIIYFRVLDNQEVVRVVRIRHGARQQPRRFDR
jgi:plasmid stabilization system protein ParE